MLLFLERGRGFKAVEAHLQAHLKVLIMWGNVLLQRGCILLNCGPACRAKMPTFQWGWGTWEGLLVDKGQQRNQP